MSYICSTAVTPFPHFERCGSGTWRKQVPFFHARYVSVVFWLRCPFRAHRCGATDVQITCPLVVLISALTSQAKDLECGGKRYSARRRFLSSVFPRVARRESGAATRAQRGSCHRTPNFPPRHARHNLLRPRSGKSCQSCQSCQKKHPAFHQKRIILAPPCH